jgi:hypothetical protein
MFEITSDEAKRLKVVSDVALKIVSDPVLRSKIKTVEISWDKIESEDVRTFVCPRLKIEMEETKKEEVKSNE